MEVFLELQRENEAGNGEASAFHMVTVVQSYSDRTMLKGVLLDLGGVVYVGDETLPGAIESVGRLKSKGFAVRFITNVTRQSRRGQLEKLARMGLQVGADEVFMPAIAA